jgi:Zn-dependent M28 family amino/carboxypeptidase
LTVWIHILRTLASDSLSGRGPGSEGETKARDFILQQLKDNNIPPYQGEYLHPFQYSLEDQEVNSYNIQAFLDKGSDSTIIISAHYDHLGFGGVKSRSLESNRIHPGADDNASGVAMMLLLAEHFQKTDAQYNFLFLSCSGHEDGLYGSKAYVQDKLPELNNIKLLINLDMVGRLDTSTNILRVSRSEDNQNIDANFEQANQSDFNFRFVAAHIEHSDAGAFIAQSIPALTLSTGIHEDYHKISDTADKINYEGMEKIYHLLILFIDKLN